MAGGGDAAVAGRPRYPLAVVDPKPEPPHGDGRPSPEDRAAGLHEATNALTVILGWLDRAKQAAHGVRDAEQALERATSHALRARNGLRRAIGAATPEEAPEAVAEVARGCVEDLEIEAAHAAVRLRLAIEVPCGETLVSHPHAVWQVLSNLLLNAIALSPKEGIVDLRVAGHEATGALAVRFTVTDQGPGLSAERAQQIFAGRGRGRAGGAGIGLPHAQALARQCGGELTLDKSSRGACFVLLWPALAADSDSTRKPPPSGPSSEPATVPTPTLPSSALGPRAVAAAYASEPQPSTKRSAEADQAPPSTGGKRRSDSMLRGQNILLLEDDDAVIELLELTLAARGARLFTIRSAAELTDALCRERFHTLLVDLSPVRGELEALVERARRLEPEIVAAEPTARR